MLLLCKGVQKGGYWSIQFPSASGWLFTEITSTHKQAYLNIKSVLKTVNPWCQVPQEIQLLPSGPVSMCVLSSSFGKSKGQAPVPILAWCSPHKWWSGECGAPCFPPSTCFRCCSSGRVSTACVIFTALDCRYVKKSWSRGDKIFVMISRQFSWLSAYPKSSCAL